MPCSFRFAPLVQSCLLVGILILTACGGGSSPATTTVAPPPKPAITVIPVTATVPIGTNEQFYVAVTAAANTGVTWTASAGTINPSGNYVAPASIPTGGTATVTATLTATPTLTASAIVTITTQPVGITISPSTATVKAGFSTTYSAKVSGTSNPFVNWSVADIPPDFTYPGSMNGGQYTAPTPILAPHTYTVIATSAADPTKSASATINAIPLENQEVQTFPIKLGTSGVNGTSPDCCSGTLGSLLVNDKGKQYILSNNHVIGRVGHAVAGEPIVQPGFIEALCDFTLPKKVASFAVAPPLAANVDAAIAEVVPGAVDPAGSIIGLGGIAPDGTYLPAPPSAKLASPAIGMAIAKSGRTTGLSCGVIYALNGSIQLDLPAECGNTSDTKVVFNGQVILSSIVRPGDSGSLIVDAATSRPLAIVDGLSSDLTFASANPASDVLTALNAATGAKLTFVGGPDHAVTCTRPTAATQFTAQDLPALTEPPSLANSAHVATPASISHQELQRAVDIQSRHEQELFAHAGVIGVAVGRNGDTSTEPAFILFLDREASASSLPLDIEGVPVQVARSGRFRPATIRNPGVCAAHPAASASSPPTP